MSLEHCCTIVYGSRGYFLKVFVPPSSRKPQTEIFCFALMKTDVIIWEGTWLILLRLVYYLIAKYVTLNFALRNSTGVLISISPTLE